MQFSVEKLRKDFPILQRKVNGKPIIYFDNAATTQKPKAVIDALVNYYTNYNANIHRGVHRLSQEATDAFEQARSKVANFINAEKKEEIIFTSGNTHSINTVASGMEKLVNKGDVILVGAAEHHSNIVPWQMLCERSGAKLEVIPLEPDGSLNLDKATPFFNERLKLVAINHVSNALGTINPVKSIIEKAHKVGAYCLIDGAQSAGHFKVDVQDLDADFYTLAGHKMYGPTGIGVLYGKQSLLEMLPPYQGGGEMIEEVRFEKTTYAGLPHKFEAGTPNIAGAIGLGAAIDYLQGLDLANTHRHEEHLLNVVTEELNKLEGIEIYGTTKEKVAVISFNIKGIHPYDLGTLLDQMNIAVRTGHHCAQPVMDAYKIPGTLRASFAFYNTKEEISIFIEALKKSIKMLQ
ncbi:MAG: cysteine desulfurase [Flavobacteriaceae bacterium]|nr:cysteine desulfurase [Flavobacteriaceae bacterium]